MNFAIHHLDACCLKFIILESRGSADTYCLRWTILESRGGATAGRFACRLGGYGSAFPPRRVQKNCHEFSGAPSINFVPVYQEKSWEVKAAVVIITSSPDECRLGHSNIGLAPYTQWRLNACKGILYFAVNVVINVVIDNTKRIFRSLSTHAGFFHKCPSFLSVDLTRRFSKQCENFVLRSSCENFIMCVYQNQNSFRTEVEKELAGDYWMIRVNSCETP